MNDVINETNLKIDPKGISVLMYNMGLKNLKNPQVNNIVE